MGTVHRITAFETSDGKLFDDDYDASKHQLDILRSALCDLVPNDITDHIGQITALQRSHLIDVMLQRNIGDMLDKVKKLHQILVWMDTGDA